MSELLDWLCLQLRERGVQGLFLDTPVLDFSIDGLGFRLRVLIVGFELAEALKVGALVLSDLLVFSNELVEARLVFFEFLGEFIVLGLQLIGGEGLLDDFVEVAVGAELVSELVQRGQESVLDLLVS